MPKDLRMTIPKITGRSTGVKVPDGILFPNMVRADGDNTPQLIGGVQKLIQQIAIEILTDTLPDGIGSNFATNLRNANPNELELIARSGVTDLLQRMLDYQERLDLPLDEKIADLQFVSLLVDETSGAFRMVLRLITTAGDAFTLEPPLV